MATRRSTRRKSASSKDNRGLFRPLTLDLEPRRWREVVIVSNLALAILLALALYTYDSRDLSRTSGDEVVAIQNLAGTPGAWIAWTCFTLFGWAAHGLPILLLLGGVFSLGRDRPRRFWLQSAALVVLVASLCALFYLASRPGPLLDDAIRRSAWNAGGLFGYYFGELMTKFGVAGSYVILVALIMLSLLLSTNILFGDVMRRTVVLAANNVQIRIRDADEVDEEDDDEDDVASSSRTKGRRHGRPSWFHRLPRPVQGRVIAHDDEDEDDEATRSSRRAALPAPQRDFDLRTATDDEEERIILPLDGRWEALHERDQEKPTESKRGRAGRKRKGADIDEDDDFVDLGGDWLTIDEDDTEAGTPSLIISTKMDDLPQPDDDESPVVDEVLDDDEEDESYDLAEPPALGTHDDPAPPPYELPSLALLDPPSNARPEILHEEIEHNCAKLKQTFQEFNIEARMVEVNYGPVITRYQIAPPPGVKLSRIVGLGDNLAMNLRAESVRIEAPIPGKGTVGIEVPNKTRMEVKLSEVLASSTFRKHKSPLAVGLGKTIEGEPYVADLSVMPHLLIAGATGAGKSVCLNTFITSVLFNNTPDEVRFLMVDPKRVELQLYAGIPHLLYPVITDPKMAGGALRWAVDEMERRYDCLARLGCRDLKSYNKKRQAQLEALARTGEEEPESRADLPPFMPYIVLIIDELADLMLVVRNEVEVSVQRLAQKARAIGIHLVLATQRPSVNVITGVIKANLPSRIAFHVSSKIDSRTILDENGAEALLGKGDMLFSPGGASKPVRVQGAFVSTEEVERVVEYACSQLGPQYEQIDLTVEEDEDSTDGFQADDDLYDEAVAIVLEHDAASTSLLQRRLKIGYGRAARLLDIMEAQGIVGPARGSKPREVLSSGGY